jgi:hypothetical protein
MSPKVFRLALTKSRQSTRPQITNLVSSQLRNMVLWMTPSMYVALVVLWLFRHLIFTFTTSSLSAVPEVPEVRLALQTQPLVLPVQVLQTQPLPPGLALPGLARPRPGLALLLAPKEVPKEVKGLRELRELLPQRLLGLAPLPRQVHLQRLVAPKEVKALLLVALLPVAPLPVAPLPVALQRVVLKVQESRAVKLPVSSGSLTKCILPSSF